MLRAALRRLAQTTTAFESLRLQPLLPQSQLQLHDIEQKRWATKKAGGTVKNSSDSKPKYLGVKKFGGEWCKPGNIIIRQRGQKYRPGEYVGLGRDFTIWALVEGQVKFWKEFVKSPLTGRCRKKTHVSVVPGKKPEKIKKERPSWFKSVRQERRREHEARTHHLKEQRRLFLYKLPKVKVLGSA